MHRQAAIEVLRVEDECVRTLDRETRAARELASQESLALWYYHATAVLHSTLLHLFLPAIREYPDLSDQAPAASHAEPSLPPREVVERGQRAAAEVRGLIDGLAGSCAAPEVAEARRQVSVQLAEWEGYLQMLASDWEVAERDGRRSRERAVEQGDEADER